MSIITVWWTSPIIINVGSIVAVKTHLGQTGITLNNVIFTNVL